MLEVRFRLSHPPGQPIYYAPWFARSRSARVYCPEVSFADDTGATQFLVLAEDGTLDLVVEDMLKLPPVPSSRDWELVEKREHAATFHGTWTEPCFGVPSLMYLLHQAAGPGTTISLLYHPDYFVTRALVPTDVADAAFWLDLRRVFLAYCRNVGVDALLELEHLAPYNPAPEAEGATILHAAFALGYYDTPPRASVRDVSTATGQPQANVLAHLKNAEQRILGRLETR